MIRFSLLMSTLAIAASLAPAVAGNSRSAKSPPPKEEAPPPAPVAWSFKWAPPTPGFSSLLEKAETVDRIDGLLWALEAKCSSGDGLEQRQCRSVRDSRQRELVASDLLIDVPASSFTLGQWDERTRSIPWTLSTCIACEGVVVDGETFSVMAGPPQVTLPPVDPEPVTKGKPKRKPKGPVVVKVVEPLAVEAPMVTSSSVVFRDEIAAQKWQTKASNVRVQFVVRLGDSPSWQHGSKKGVSLELLGYRVWSPCDGTIIAASDTVTKGPLDASKCNGMVDENAVEIVNETLPRTREEIAKIMNTAVMRAEQCKRDKSQTGVAHLRVSVAGDGTVTKFEQTGPFVGTPLGACIDKSMAGVRFSGNRQATSFQFPIMLR